MQLDGAIADAPLQLMAAGTFRHEPLEIAVILDARSHCLAVACAGVSESETDAV
jgi:hypothetical protein